MLKADLHLHAKEDKQDHISYSARQLVDLAAQKGFEVLSFTFHNKVFFSKKLEEYAAKKGILLIPGCELKLEGSHILLYNKSAAKLKGIVQELRKGNSIQSLRKLKTDCLVIIPHAYYLVHSLGTKTEEYIDIFDGLEYSHFYYRWIDLNKKATKIAAKHKKPLIGSSDLHRLYHFDYTYSLINADKNIEAVFSAIRKGKVEVKTRQLPLKVFLWLGILNVLRRT